MYDSYLISKNNDNSLSVREKAEEFGVNQMNSQELIMLILGSGVKDNPIEKLSKKVLYEIEKNQNDSLYERLSKIKGMGKGKISIICASIELGKRIFNTKKRIIKTPEDLIPLVQHYALEYVEHFICISLNGAHEVINIHEISKGNNNTAIVQPRDVFSALVIDRACAVIFVHNHPSGNVTPSQPDINMTERLIEAGKLIGVQVLDHIIISENKYFSFANEDIFSKIQNKLNKLLI